jgi:hypothetical protein
VQKHKNYFEIKAQNRGWHLDFFILFPAETIDLREANLTFGG